MWAKVDPRHLDKLLVVAVVNVQSTEEAYLLDEIFFRAVFMLNSEIA
jgi:hypothetical protein